MEKQREERGVAVIAPSSHFEIELKLKVSSVRGEDLRRVNLIGNGRFCKVYLAAGPSWLLSKSKSESKSDINSPNNNNEEQPRRPPSLVAVKCVDTSKVRDAADLALVTRELNNEAKVLSELDHENIIRLRAVCNSSESQCLSSSAGLHHSYWGSCFLVFEVLRGTLSDRLQKWRRQKVAKEKLYKKSKEALAKWHVRFFPKIEHSSQHQAQQPKGTRSRDASLSTSTVTTASDLEPEPDERRRRMHHRIKETVLGIANGLDYLHSKGIVLRDLKPANIGYEETPAIQYGSASSTFVNTHSTRNLNNNQFDVEPTSTDSIRLFDFGMAQKVEACDPLEECGSLRYMAPEVMAGKGYSLKVDVYSFGVVLFEICSLCHPFAETTKKQKQKQKHHKILRNLSLLRWRKSGPNCKTPRGRGPEGNNNTDNEAEENKNENDRLVEDFRKQFLAGDVVPCRNLDKSVGCPDLKTLIEDCCAFDPIMRPTFHEIRSRLYSILHKDDAPVGCSSGDDDDDNDDDDGDSLESNEIRGARFEADELL